MLVLGVKVGQSVIIGDVTLKVLEVLDDYTFVASIAGVVIPVSYTMLPVTDTIRVGAGEGLSNLARVVIDAPKSVGVRLLPMGLGSNN